MPGKVRSRGCTGKRSALQRAIDRTAGCIAILIACAAAGLPVSAATPDPGIEGVTAGSGSLFVAGTEIPFLPQGFTSLGVLYPRPYAHQMCTQPNNKPESTQGRDLIEAEIRMTTDTSRELLTGMISDWKANTVRFQISQGALQHEYEHGLSEYTDMVRKVVAQAREAHLIVILVLQTEPYSCSPLRSDGMLQKLPDQLTEEAWTQLLSPALTHDKGVILEIFNEPNTKSECGTSEPYNWIEWENGCSGAASEGMVTVGRYVSRLAPDNVLLFDGDNNAGGFAGFSVPANMPSDSAYTVHPFFYDYGDESKSEDEWNTRFGYFQASGHTVLVTAWNEAATCPDDPNQSVTDLFILEYLPRHHIGLLAVAWDGPPVDAEYLVRPDFSPVDSNSACHITGAALIKRAFDGAGTSGPLESAVDESVIANPSLTAGLPVTAEAKEEIRSRLYGVNGQERNTVAWDQVPNPDFDAALKKLNLGILRFPAGTGANYWDWRTGDFDGYYRKKPSNYPSPISELALELASASNETQTSADFVLNLLTDPDKCELGASHCLALSPSSPNWAFQQPLFLQGVDIPYVELGNEYWLEVPDYVDVYPNRTSSEGYDIAGKEYAELLSNEEWVENIKDIKRTIQVGAAAKYLGPHGRNAPLRETTWNESFFSASKLPDVDALVLHIYVPTNFSALPGVRHTLPFGDSEGGKGFGSNVTATMLAVPFHIQADIAKNYLSEGVFNSKSAMNQLQAPGFEPDIWVTEYNLGGPDYAAFGTWAHGLFEGTMSLKFLENRRASSNSARVTMALVHETHGNSVYAEIFDSDVGFAPSSGITRTYPASANLPTSKNSLTAVGLVEQQINQAAIGQKYAAQLSFAGVAKIADPSGGESYPALYGWQFSGHGATQLIVLNLSSFSEMIDVSRLVRSGHYWQLQGSPGAYVQGDTTAGMCGALPQGKYAASDLVDLQGKAVCDPVLETAGPLLSNRQAVFLPAYSITRIAGN